jgi:hypothetical protein
MAMNGPSRLRALTVMVDPKLARGNLRFSTGTKVYTLRSFLSGTDPLHSRQRAPLRLGGEQGLHHHQGHRPRLVTKWLNDRF